MRTRVTLTTDFGTRDSYVAQLKGVLYALGPSSLEVIDLTHELPAQHIREAAWFVREAWPRFPAGTIHVVVVDPGVGSSRHALALQHGSQVWLGPDNGVMSWLVDETTSAYTLAPELFTQGPVSATFHGRDVFAPAAALLAHGRPLSALGRPLATELTRLPWPSSVRDGATLQGEVLHVDRFGNAITNLTRAELLAFAGAAGLSRLRVQVSTRDPFPVLRCYADASGSEPLALVGSAELLEIAIKNGHAARELALDVGTALAVTVVA